MESGGGGGGFSSTASSRGQNYRASGFTGQGGEDPFSEFSKEFFKNKGADYYEGFSSGGTTRKRKGEDITKVVELSFVEAAKGTKVSNKSRKRSSQVR